MSDAMSDVMIDTNQDTNVRMLYDIQKNEFKDPKLEWETMDEFFQDASCFKKRFQFINKCNEGGQGSIYYSQLIGTDSYNITKVYKTKNKRQRLKVFQEWRLIRQSRLLSYGAELFYDDTTKEIYMPMAQMDITLPDAIRIPKDDKNYNVYSLEFENVYNLKYFVLEIAGCLQMLHHRCYVHLDINPNNIMMRNHACKTRTYASRNGWKLIDYGLIKFIPPTHTNILLDHFSGTSQWEAPECQKTANKNKPNVISCKTDIFSFGLVILYIIHGGHHVFRYEENKKDENKKDESITKQYIYLNKYNKSKFDEVVNQYLIRLLQNNRINNPLYEILSQMLKYEQNERISALEIIKHSWLREFIRYRVKTSRICLILNNDRYRSARNKKIKYAHLTSVVEK